MTIWTTFCPSKICWELTYARTKGNAPTSNWLDKKQLIQSSLQTLKKVGISGIRLVIFPSEVTQDGKKYDWSPVDIMLDLCKKQGVAVIFCLGPFQYPYYPGIYLPPKLLTHIFDNKNALDTNPVLRQYGISFLQLQLERYGNNPDVVGFHLANEWPDSQVVSGKEHIKKTISDDFMTKASSLIVATTDKLIGLNTNIDVSDKKRLTNIFTNILTILNNQGMLGFDIYPTQETWRKALLQKLRRFFESYNRSFAWSKKAFPKCEIYFAEVEAQPWGDGRAWYTIMQQEPDPQRKVLSYSRESLPRTWKQYIKPTGCSQVSLWGADFWLAASEMGIFWPLEQIRHI